MQVLMWTMGMIMLLSLFTYARLEQFLGGSYQSLFFFNTSEMQHESDKEEIEKRYLLLNAYEQDSSPRTSKWQPSSNERAKGLAPKSSVLFLDLVPHTAQLNLAALFRELTPSEASAQGQKISGTGEFYRIAARLMRYLYKNQPFFNEVAGVEFLLLGALLEGATINPVMKNETSSSCKQLLKSSEDLSSFVFQDAKLQNIWYRILKGGEGEDGYPSLLKFVGLEPRRRKFWISIHHAPLELIAALFDHEVLAGEIVETRENYYLEGRRKNKKGAFVTEKFLTKIDLEAMLSRYGRTFCDYEKLVQLAVQKPIRQDLLHEPTRR